MVCLGNTPEANFINPGEWSFPDMIMGFIPIIWTSGSYIPALQEINPWMGLLVPDNFRWDGSTLRIIYFSGRRKINGCWLNFPPTVVQISFHCTAGVHQFHIIVTSGNRMIQRNLWNIPGSWIVFNDQLILDSSVGLCTEKYFPFNTALSIDIRVLVEWLQLARDYSVSSSGNTPSWFQYVLDNIEDDQGGLQSICLGCSYGLLPKALDITEGEMDDILSSYDQLTGFPVKEGDFGYIRLCNDKSVIVINAIEYVYTIYRELDAFCSSPVLISGYGQLSPDCVEVIPPRPSLPSDNDPRWISRCGSSTSSTCSLSGLRSPAGFDSSKRAYGIHALKDGVYYNLSFSQLPREWIAETPDPPPGIPREEYALVGYWTVKDKKVTAIDGATGACTTFFLKEVTTIRLEEYIGYALDKNGVRTPQSIQNEQTELNYRDAWDMQLTANKQSCLFQFNAPPPPPPVIERKEKNDEDGNCYIMGDIHIGLLGSMDKKIRLGTDGDIDRVRNIVAPVVRTEVTQAAGVPTGITIPFKFRMPTGKSTLGTVTVNVIGTALIAVTFGNIDDQILINLEEIFAYYNFAQQVLGFLVPGKVMILNLKAFCE